MARKKQTAKKFVKAASKQTSKSAKQVSRTIKAASKTAKKISKAIKSTAKKAAKKQAKKTASVKNSSTKTASKSSTQKTFTTRAVRINKKFDTFAEKMEYIYANADSINAQLRQGEMFTATYMSGQMRILYTDIRLLINKVNEYQMTRLYKNDHGEDGEVLMDSFKIQKFGKLDESNKNVAREYRSRRDIRDKERKVKRNEAMKALGEIFGRTDKETRQPKSTSEMLYEAANKIKELKASQDKLTRKFEKLGKSNKNVARYKKSNEAMKTRQPKSTSDMLYGAANKIKELQVSQDKLTRKFNALLKQMSKTSKKKKAAKKAAKKITIKKAAKKITIKKGKINASKSSKFKGNKKAASGKTVATKTTKKATGARKPAKKISVKKGKKK